ncbi:hypothetical protein LUZ62_038622 [Rhynchospora pubera]|uniref:Uncharacterized protein n=1 Tax=Rhynchospora pubera TaxID=906938 RepID=A0AAV8F9N9_9POAL|nr:hypothetical protein LUZ62_038622 [Rhynchospora pubera]
MARLAHTLCILYLILLFHFASGRIVRVEEGKKPDNSVTKGDIRSRKVLMEAQDYDYGQPNCKHDPRNRKPNCPKIP